MSLEMKPACQTCSAATPESGVAYICSYECTFCAACADRHQQCPNCQGELLARPRRGDLDNAPSVIRQRLEEFNQAWAKADVEGLTALITDDCVYAASVGSEPGTTYVGRDEVERGFREILAYEKGTEGDSGPMFIFGHRAFCHWSYVRSTSSGQRVQVRGCDWFEFDGNLICRKDAFIKSLPME